MISWYVLRIVPVHRLEFQVMHAINQREHPAMVPYEDKKLRKRGQREWKTERYPLFPCYVFAGFASHLEANDTRRIINEHAERMGKRPPVLGLVGFGGRPATLSDHEAAFLRTLSIDRATDINFHKAIKPGTKINILDGAFAGHPAVVDSVTKRGVKAMLRLFNSMQLVEISSSALEAA